MHVKDLRAALQEITEVFAAAGAKPVQKDLASLLELLDDKDELELATFLQHLRRDLADKPGPDEWLRRLNEAQVDEASFLQVFSDLRKAPCTKTDLLAIAEIYARTKFKSKDSKNLLLDAIKSEFYGRLYDHDADKIAARATPW
jgi:hypothetical protein